MVTERSGPTIQKIGGKATDFKLQDLTGVTRSLREEVAYRKAAVVVFWSGVCSHCNRYDEYFCAFNDRHPDIVLLAVASRRPETPDLLRQTAEKRTLTFPILLDPGGVVARQWSTEQTPRAFLIAPDLSLQYRGAIDNFQFAGNPDYVEYLEPAIADFLAGRPIAQQETASFGCAIQSVYYQLPKII